mmetsp:Transcript_120162/g.365522  ORF Transcript_120162/g.365522 Transcript_120162/m.365522 type:complete len:285 (+) Transcript_120162:37-891(+)
MPTATQRRRVRQAALCSALLAWALARAAVAFFGAPQRPPARTASAAAPAGAVEDVAGIEFYTMDMCPYAQRTWIVLEEKQLPYTRRLVNIRNETERSWYVEQVNPLGKVPSIRDSADGTVVYESEIVNEYLEHKFADRADALMPADAAGCASVRLWNHHLSNKLAPAHFTFLMNKDDATEDEKRQALEEALQYYEANLVGPYLVGDQFTLADVSALPFFERLVFSCRRFKSYEIPEAMPRLHAWLDRVMQRPSFLVTKRPDDKLEEVYRMFIDRDYKFGGLNRN